MLSVTNIKIDLISYWNKHTIYIIMVAHLQPCNGLHPICNVCLLATELDIEDFLDPEDNSRKLLRAAFVSGADGRVSLITGLQITGLEWTGLES